MKPAYDSRPSVPAATPKSDAVRLRMLEMTWSSASVVRVPAVLTVRYLIVVLHATCDNGVDCELSLFVEG